MLRLTVVLMLLTLSVPQGTSQTANCAPRERRGVAIQLARQINSAEATKFQQSQRYVPIGELRLLSSSDYTVQLSTDGASYSFSIKDTMDACHGVVFSDQEGVIYTGAPLQ